MTTTDWILVALAATVYLATCARAAMAARRLGRRPLAWFWITLLGTAIPAMIVFGLDMRRRKRELREARARQAVAPLRCPHCQAILGAEEHGAGPLKVCPRCRLSIDEVKLA